MWNSTTGIPRLSQCVVDKKNAKPARAATLSMPTQR